MTLKKAIALLKEKYEEGKRSKYVRDPLAWALYQVWKRADEGRDR